MRFLIVSDLHEIKIEDLVPPPIIKSVDYIISAGDYLHYPFPKPAIGVYGNHDSLEEVFQRKSLINCHMQIVKVANLTFLGIQGVFSPHPRKWYHNSEQEVKRFLIKQPKVNFFITHERASGIFDRLNSGKPFFTEYILKRQPDYYISGHVCADGDLLKKGSTLCLNPHPCNKKRFILLDSETEKIAVVDRPILPLPSKPERRRIK